MKHAPDEAAVPVTRPEESVRTEDVEPEAETRLVSLPLILPEASRNCVRLWFPVF